MKIGFIGLGIMGAPMARNLIKGGHELFLHTRSGVPAGAARRGRQAPATRPRRSREKADIIITMVPDTPDVEEVLFGDGRRRRRACRRARSWST